MEANITKHFTIFYSSTIQYYLYQTSDSQLLMTDSMVTWEVLVGGIVLW